jgi:hypothetical protein
MRRFITVEIDIDEELVGESYFQGDRFNLDRFFIVVRRDDEPIANDPHHNAIGLMHELGHLVATVFNLPGMKYDPRNPNRTHLGQESFGQLILKSEQEAWDLTDFMFHRDRQREYYLNTYRRDYLPSKESK